VTGSGPLTAELWSSIDATYGAILEHPFIAGLTDGSLDQAAFRFYVIQDAHYLREFARALSVAAARAPEERDIAMFNEHAAGAIAVERQLHESFFSDFGVSEADVAATPMAPTNLAYTSYLLAVAYAGRSQRPWLPCFPATGSTGRSASSYSSAARRTRCIGVGSQPTGARSTPRSCRRC
jgi:thiaminase (transcriptional activator TenA)